MKCLKCGTEIENKEVYCPKCGEAIVLVPEYDVLEEELLFKVVEDKSKVKEDKFAEGVYKKTEAESSAEETTATTKEKSKEYFISKKLLIILISALVTIIVLGIAVILYYNYSHTYEYRMGLATSAEENGQYVSALEYYEEAVSLNSSSFEALYGLGRMYFQTKNYTDAVTEFSLALALDKENIEIYEYLLKCYENLEDRDGINALAESAPNEEILNLVSEYIVIAPSFSLSGGEYHSKITLYLTSGDDYDIFYTTNGKDPSISGIKYVDPIVLGEGETTLSAVCVNAKGEYSEVVSETYSIVIKQVYVPTPVVEPVDGIYYEQVMISISVPDGYLAYYTWDGTDPVDSGILYTEPFPILEGASVLWVTYIDGSGNSSTTPYKGNYVYITEELQQENQ